MAIICIATTAVMSFLKFAMIVKSQASPCAEMEVGVSRNTISVMHITTKVMCCVVMALMNGIVHIAHSRVTYHVQVFQTTAAASVTDTKRVQTAGMSYSPHATLDSRLLGQSREKQVV